MKDPFYTGIIFAIENKIHEGDREANAQGLHLTDSNIRSLLIKAVHAAQGKPLQSVPETAGPKDQRLGRLLEELTALGKSLDVQEELSDGSIEHQALATADWIASLEEVKKSCSLHAGGEPGSRDYLDFLTGFLAQAGRRK